MHHRGADGRGGISCNRIDPKSITATILQTVSSSVIPYKWEDDRNKSDVSST